MGFVKVHTQELTDADKRQQPRDLPGLIESMQSDDVATRRWAVRDLANFPDATAALLNRLSQEHDRTVREAILIALTQLGNDVAVTGLVDCLRSEDVNLRNEAIEALKQLPENLAPLVQRLLVDPDPDVRIFMVNILESLRHAQVEEWLLQVIRQDPHVNVCAAAVDVLAEAGSEQALQPLQALKSRFRDEPFMHFAIDVAIKRIQGD